MTRGWRRAQWLVPVVVALLAACAEPINGPTAAPAATPEPTAPAAPAPEPTCEDSAIRLVDRGEGIHGAIVDDVLHMGGETASAACSAPVNQSLAGALDGRTAQAQQSQYYLIVIRYPGGNRLYNISRRADGTTCVVDTNDQCIAQVTDLPDDFDLDTLPFDVEPTIPAGRPAPANDTPGDDAPPAAPAPSPPQADDAPDEPPSPLPVKQWTLDVAQSSDVHFPLGLEEVLRAPNVSKPFVWDEITADNVACVKVGVLGHPWLPWRFHPPVYRRFGTLAAKVDVGQIVLTLTAESERGGRNYMMYARDYLHGKTLYAHIDCDDA